MEPSDAIPPKFLEAAHGFHHRALAARTRLGIKLVGIAYYLLFERDGHKLFVGQRQLLLLDVPLGESCACMSLAHQGMTLPPLLAQDFSPNDAVTYVRFSAEALYAWGITTEDADIVEHGCLLEELGIEP